jgi:hypothetical protein
LIRLDCRRELRYVPAAVLRRVLITSLIAVLALPAALAFSKAGSSSYGSGCKKRDGLYHGLCYHKRRVTVTRTRTVHGTVTAASTRTETTSGRTTVVKTVPGTTTTKTVAGTTVTSTTTITLPGP